MDTMTTSEVLATARQIAEEYQNDGLTLTLRQLYYQFVARGLFPSGDKPYKRLGQILTKARYSGDFPIDWIDDRGRSMQPGEFTMNDVDPARGVYQLNRLIENAPRAYLGCDKWLNQPNHVSVWVEKEALSGIIGGVADNLGVSWFACKGYPSVSSLRDWLREAFLATCGSDYVDGDDTDDMREATRYGGCERCTILYLGDHDPDGLEIPHAAERGLRKLMRVTGWYVDLTFKRIALTREQIQQYSPPPFPAKLTSARYHKYVQQTGLTQAWELDALEPRVLRALITTHVEALFDRSVARRNADVVYEAREKMREAAAEAGFMETALDGTYEVFTRDDVSTSVSILSEATEDDGMVDGTPGDDEDTDNDEGGE